MPEYCQLTRKQKEVFDFLVQNQSLFSHPPTLDELCAAMGLKSRGSMHKHIQALVEAGLLEATNKKQRGVRMTTIGQQKAYVNEGEGSYLPLVGIIAAGKPIEAIENVVQMMVPDQLRTEKPCYILKVSGDSMVEDGIFDGDWVVIEQRSHARNGEIVVALIDKTEATLKHIEQYPHQTRLIPANQNMLPMHYLPSQVEIQGVLVGQMRRYLH